MGLVKFLLGQEARVVIVDSTEKNHVQYLNMSGDVDIYEMCKREIRSNPDSYKIQISNKGTTITVE